MCMLDLSFWQGGWSALSIADKTGHTDLCMKRLEMGADVSAKLDVRDVVSRACFSSASLIVETSLIRLKNFFL